MPQITETTETKHLRNSKLYLLFYSIYEISEWSNRIEIEHKRTHENLKTEQKTSQNIQKYVFPSKKLEENVLACPNVLFYHLKVSYISANTFFIYLQRWSKVDCISAIGL